MPASMWILKQSLEFSFWERDRLWEFLGYLKSTLLLCWRIKLSQTTFGFVQKDFSVCHGESHLQLTGYGVRSKGLMRRNLKTSAFSAFLPMVPRRSGLH